MNIFKNIKYIKNEKINFKSRIFLKLVFYFGISLLLFSVVAGSVFASMYVRNTVNLNKRNLEIRALKVSETISRFWYADKPKIELKEHGDRKQHRKNMRMIEDIAMAKVWVIEKDSGSIIQEKDTPERNVPETYRILPPNAEKAVSTAFKGTVNTTEDFNEFLDKKALTTAAPIFKNGEVVGVVLLHSPIENLSTALNNGIYTLVISIFVALILASISAILLSLSFTKPLNKIKNTAILLSEGDYEAQTDVKQNDEIGNLAQTIDKLAIQLFKSSKESEHFEKMRQDFIINVSHELRTPVTVIRGSMEALCDNIITEPEKIDEYHKQILSESIHLQKLINDLIDLSKLQNTDFSIEKSPLSLYEIANDAARSMKQPAGFRNIDITVTCNENPDDYIFEGDYFRIRQMIIIILDNAIKFSYENTPIKINIGKTVSENGIKGIKMDISNKGNGIADKDINNIFERFHKSEGENNESGMGLGLAIAKQIAIRHDIEISVSSIPNEETVFSFIFPVK